MRLLLSVGWLLMMSVSMPTQAQPQEGSAGESAAEAGGTTERTLSSAAAFELPALPERLTVTEVLVRCDSEPCEAQLGASLLALTELGGRTEVTRDEIETAGGRLAALGFFGSIQVYTQPDPQGGEQLVLDGQLVDVIRSIRIRSGLALGDEIRRRLFLRGGQPWSGDPAVVERQRAAIQEYFEADGFFRSQVRIIAQPWSLHEYDLQIQAQRGSRRTLGRIYLRGMENLTYNELRDTLVGEFSLTRSFTRERFDRAQDALVESYRRAGYLQARIVFDAPRFNEDDTVDLFIEVREGDLWRVEFRGNRLLSDRQLRDSLLFLQTGFIDDEEIRLAARSIKARYETIGHYLAEVTPVQTRDEDGTRVLAFEIEEGISSEVRRIDLTGVGDELAAELRPLLATTEYDLVAVGGYLQRSVLDQDVSTLEAGLQERGYLRGRVSRITIVGENDGRDLHVRFHIDPGPVTIIERIEDSVLQDLPARVQRQLTMRAGKPFNVQGFQQDMALAQSWYRNQGYPWARVTGSCLSSDGTVSECNAPQWPPDCRFTVSGATTSSCTMTNRAGDIVEECILVRAAPECSPSGGIQSERLSLTVERELSGSATFGQVFFRGNFRTRSSILRRELPFQPGDPLVFDRVLQGQSAIRSLRIFDSVRVQTIWNEPEGTDNNVAHVLVQVEENRTRFIEHRVALESRVTPQSDLLFIFSNEPSFRNVNFLGRAEEFRVAANFDIDTVNPDRIAEDEYRAGASITYLDPRMYFGRLLRDPWELRAEAAWRYDLLAVAPAPLRRTLESSVTVREEFDAIAGLFLEGGVSIRRTSVLDQSDPLVVLTEFEPALILSLTPRLTMERRDNPLNPTRGWFSQVQLEIADDFVGVLNSARFTKLTSRASGYLPLGAGFVGGVNVRFGAAVGGLSQGFRSPSQFALPLSERFALGGVTSLRGFAQGQISSLSTDEFGGDAVLGANLELRYPFAPDWGVYGATFIDAGQIARDLDEFAPDEFRLSTGFGLRILIAELLPVLVDYGAVLDRRPGEPFGRLHFNIGYTF